MDLEGLVPDADCRLAVFLAGKGEVVGGVEAFRRSALKREWQRVQESSNRARSNTVPDLLDSLVGKAAGHVGFGIGTGNHIDRLDLLLQRLDDLVQEFLPVCEEWTDHVFTGGTD